MLIKELNNRKGALLPEPVKQNFLALKLTRRGLEVPEATTKLLHWVISSMPEIAAIYGIRGQVLDGFQHYRFGFTQAENLIDLTQTHNFSENIDREMIALFTAVHDLGRMMVGSGASIDHYKIQGSFLHPIVGAMILREVIEPIWMDLSEDMIALFKALITTAERHTLSIGLMASIVKAQRINEIETAPYHLYNGDLLMVHIEMGKYGKYAHLIALADLINNISVKLAGV